MKILKNFWKPSFIISMIMLFIMSIFVLIGNPRIVNWSVVCWHHIPEMICIFFLGFWICEIKIEVKYVFMVYIYSIIITLFLINTIIKITDIFESIILILIITSPFLLGYYIKKIIKK